MIRSKPTVSLVVTGGERPPELERFFQSIAAQAYAGRVQVVFVDQAGAGAPAGVPLPSYVDLRVIPAGGRLPLSIARNRAMPLVDGDIVAFPDDDCWFSPGLLDAVASWMDAHPDVDCLCTSVFDPEKELFLGKRTGSIAREITDWNLFRYPISVGIFVRRQALDAAGARFDEELGVGSAIGSGEETELLARLLDQGMRVVYDGSIRVYHPVATWVESDIRKYDRYGFGFGYLNGRLARAGRPKVVLHLVEVMVRSVGGAAYHARDAVRRGVYLARLRGIMRGFMVAVTGGVARP